jgi:cytoskeletal protein CcmA (bactofilin family)
MDNSKDFSFSGRGTLGAGDYGKHHFSGSGSINGDITCTNIHSSGALHASGNIKCAGSVDCSGSFKCGGRVQCESLNSSGGITIEKDAECRHLHSSGSTKIGGSLTGGMIETSGSLQIEGSILSGSLDISGSVKVEQNVRIDTADVRGSFKVGGDCEAERFQSSGKVTVNGLLNAEEILIKLSRSESLIGEIGGEKIEVRRGLLTGILDLPSFTGYLVTNSIEGDEIYLENTKAKIVRGSKVRIGSGCEIDTVEYTDSFDKSGDAVVRELKKVGSESNE